MPVKVVCRALSFALLAAVLLAPSLEENATASYGSRVSRQRRRSGDPVRRPSTRLKRYDRMRGLDPTHNTAHEASKQFSRNRRPAYEVKRYGSEVYRHKPGVKPVVDRGLVHYQLSGSSQLARLLSAR